ncbi:hypothetical protein J6590_094457 [Homalodisca vitripennis]|nr:hypothetical protein J6590_094457 [Homalodisca vitripennis]
MDHNTEANTVVEAWRLLFVRTGVRTPNRLIDSFTLGQLTVIYFVNANKLNGLKPIIFSDWNKVATPTLTTWELQSNKFYETNKPEAAAGKRLDLVNSGVNRAHDRRERYELTRDSEPNGFR